MAEGNGQQPNLSRLERIEAAVAAFIDDHERLRADHERYRARHERLAEAQEAWQHNIILLQDSQLRIQRSINDLTIQVAETGGKVNAVVGAVDQLIATVDHDHREFHDRLNRLEAKQ